MEKTSTSNGLKLLSQAELLRKDRIKANSKHAYYLDGQRQKINQSIEVHQLK